jgi:hypothetical protein
MFHSLRNLKTSEIELRQRLPALEGEWLVGRLLAKQGVAAAQWRGNTCRLLVEYDADVFGSTEIIDFLHSCGVPVAAVRVGAV